MILQTNTATQTALRGGGSLQPVDGPGEQLKGSESQELLNCRRAVGLGPRYNDGQGSLINGGQDFDGGGFFTGYWLTTGSPELFDPEMVPPFKWKKPDDIDFVDRLSSSRQSGRAAILIRIMLWKNVLR